MTEHITLRLGLAEAVAHWGRYKADKVAFRSDSTSLTYGELDARVHTISDALHALGVAPQKPVALLASAQLSFLTSLIAVLRRGAQAIILNPFLPARNLEAALQDSGCRFMIIDEDSYTGGEPPRVEGCVSIPYREVTDATGTGRRAPAVVRAADWIWGVIYSSGTTGTPKGIIRTDMSILMELIGWCREVPIVRDSNVYVGRPMFYTGGLVIASAALLAGGTVIAPREHTADFYWDLCARVDVDFAFFLPDQVRALIAKASHTGERKRGSKRILTMGAPISIQTKQSIRDVLGSEPVESWGNSEGLGTITEPGDLDRRPGSIGRPFVTDSMSIVDEQGNDLPARALGRIAGSTDTRLLRYNNRDDLNAALLKGDMVISEDYGYIDQDGYFYIAGRVSERIVCRGAPVFASDIEQVLVALPPVAAAVVVGLPHDEHGQAPAAAVVLTPQATVTRADLLAMANERLSDLHKLSRLRVVTDFERNAAGKIKLDAVRELLAR